MTASLVLSKASEQLRFSKRLSRTTPSIIKLGIKSLLLKMTHAMDMFLPIGTKELFYKTTVPKRQANSLKSTCQVVSFYYICKLCTWNLLKTILSQVSKIFFKFSSLKLLNCLWYTFIWNSTKSNNLLHRSFSKCFSLSI